MSLELETSNYPIQVPLEAVVLSGIWLLAAHAWCVLCISVKLTMQALNQ